MSEGLSPILTSISNLHSSDLTETKNPFPLPVLIFFILMPVLLGSPESLIGQRRLQVFNLTVPKLSNSRAYESPLREIRGAVQLKPWQAEHRKHQV